MKNSSRHNTQAGYSLLEVMIALAILLVGIYAVIEGTNQMKNLSKDTQVLSSVERQINAVADNIRTGISDYQITSDSSEAVRTNLLRVDNLPMGWDVGVTAPKAECKGCRGTYGYVIQPMENYRGLYRVTIRFTFREWAEPYRDYEFLVMVK